MKINIDTTVFQDGSIEVGAIIRNAQGRFVEARCRRSRERENPEKWKLLGQMRHCHGLLHMGIDIVCLKLILMHLLWPVMDYLKKFSLV